MKRLLGKLKARPLRRHHRGTGAVSPRPLGSGAWWTTSSCVKPANGTIDHFHPDLTKCLEPTYGVIVYQEQVMQISQIIGGYTPVAPTCCAGQWARKAEEMAKHRATIADGAAKKGYDRRWPNSRST